MTCHVCFKFLTKNVIIILLKRRYTKISCRANRLSTETSIHCIQPLYHTVYHVFMWSTSTTTEAGADLAAAKVAKKARKAKAVGIRRGNTGDTGNTD